MNLAAGRHYPHWIHACTEISETAPSPKLFRKWAAISAVAGALGRKCWYDFGQFKTGSNLYIVLVAPAGAGKGTALGLPFGSVFRRLAVPLGATTEGAPGYHERWKLFGVEAPIWMGSHKTTPEQLMVDLSKIGRIEGDLSLYDEKAEMFFNSSATVVTSEFGTFMRRDDAELQNFMTEMWDWLPDYNYRTKTQGQYLIKGPCVNWIACATPQGFIDNLPKTARAHGLMSRIIPVYYDGPDMQDAGFKLSKFPEHDMNFLTEDLARIANIKGEFDFTPDALTFANDWWQSGAEPKPTSETMTEYLNRRKSHLTKLCMVVSASKRDDRLITLEDFKEAQELLFEAEAFIPRALEKFGRSETGQMTDKLVEVLKLNPKGMRLEDFMKHVIHVARTPGEAKQIVDTMIATGQIEKHNGKIIPGKNL